MSAKKEFPGIIFYLTDPSPNMLKQAEKSIYKRSNIIKPTESSNLCNYINKKFDVIIAIQSHHY